MSELFAWIPWFQELARKIADNDANYFVPRVRKVWSSAVGSQALLTKSDADLDPFSFFYSLASKNGTKQWKPLHDAISEEFSIPPIGVDASEGFYFPTPPGFVGMFQEKPDLLRRLFREAVRGFESVRQEEFDGALAIKGVGVPKLTQTLFLINPRAFLPFDDKGLAPLRPGIMSVHNWKTYGRELRAVRDMFPGCEPYEIQHFAYAVFGSKEFKVKDAKVWQTSTLVDGDKQGTDYWDDFRSNGWIYHRGPDSGGKSRRLHEPAPGDLVFVRTGASRGRGIGVVHANDHKKDWTPEQRLHVLWLNTMDAENMDGIHRRQAFSAAGGVVDAFRSAPVYAPTFELLKQLGWPPKNEPTESDLKALAEETLISEAELRKIAKLLEDKKQVIFQGPPGTGKTYLAMKLAGCLAGTTDRVRLVQFHPSYSYEDFVQGFRPSLEGGSAGFALRDGPLLEMAELAQRSDEKHFLVIDEINRGNLSRILGELYFLLEYRDKTIQLQYSSEGFRLPENLYLIGTMNTADRSIALVDLALRRRFHFVEFHPDKPPIKGLLGRWLADKAPATRWVEDVVRKANEKLDDRHAAIGPSFFMREGLDEARVETIWKHNVLPYIEERLFGQEERLKDFDLDTLRGKAEKNSGTDEASDGTGTTESGDATS
ncbi:MAG: AAA family ATPase [Acidobacteriota bacterium]|nr:AAA family ATPase [Acidobacteriota bacterium]